MSAQENAETCIEELMLIDGIPVSGPRRLEVRNPARPSELVGTIVRGTIENVHDSIAAAKRAQPAWASLSFGQRAEMLSRAVVRLEGDIDIRSRMLVRENGKPLREARAEIAATAKRQYTALSYATELDAGRILRGANGRTLVRHRPYGVVVSIVPWNSPIMLAFTQIVAALLAGNCVVLKPPETCPLTLIRSVRMFAEMLPPGMINIVTGLPSEIGDALTTHPDVGKIGFTGSIASARHIMANAAQSIKGVTLELGGNDAAIILEDADLGAEAIQLMLDATFHMSGQVCMAIKRIYVPQKRYNEFLESFCRAVDSLVVGDGLESRVNLGPLHTKAAQSRAQQLLSDAGARGADIQTLGKIDSGDVFAEGYFMRPSVVTSIDDDAALVIEEQFCPIIPIAVYDEIDSAIERANRSIYGLSGSIWSRDVEYALGVAHRIDAGQVWINAHGPYAINHNAPYGGVKQSGIGRKSGIEGILEYLQTQTITAHKN